MKLIAYISDLVEQNQNTGELLVDIYQTSKRNNENKSIDGLLFFTGTQFIQVIEGPDQAVSELMQIIQNDKRHTNVNIILDAEVQEATFSEWNMQPLDLTDQSKFSNNQLSKALALVTRNVEATAESFVFMVKELLSDPEFRALL